MRFMIQTSNFIKIMGVCKPFVDDNSYRPGLQQIYCEVHNDGMTTKACNGCSMIETKFNISREDNESEDFTFFLPIITTKIVDPKRFPNMEVEINSENIILNPMGVSFKRLITEYPVNADIDRFIGSMDTSVPNFVGIDPKLLNKAVSAFKSERVVKLTTLGILKGILIQSENMRALVCAKRAENVSFYKEA